MIDLHIHTTFSDGEKDVATILKMAEEKGLVAISITDHDCLDAYDVLKNPEIRALYSGKIITGVEMSTNVNGTMVHILGYGFDVDKMKNYIVRDDGALERRLVEKKFAEIGVIAKIEGTVGREITENAVVALDNSDFKMQWPEGVVKSLHLWWDHFNNRDSFLFLDLASHFMSPSEAIDKIHACGGVAILAHPAQYKQFDMEIVEKLKNKVDGIECYHWVHDEEYREKLIKICKDNGLIITGGSDYHGLLSPLGSQNVPSELLGQHEVLNRDY
ncbi:MAG: PHP domain-containing protein [Firmicutes bacterium]|nr:PHP domain-containing protein [Bacillota bacterium]